MQKVRRIFHRFAKPLTVIAIIIICVVTSTAHPGRTDGQGGHHVSGTSEYHYHHGHPAHQHPNGVCPYRKDTQKADTPAEPEKSGPQINGLYIFVAAELTAAAILFGAYRIFARLGRCNFKSLLQPEYFHKKGTPMGWYDLHKKLFPYFILTTAINAYAMMCPEIYDLPGAFADLHRTVSLFYHGAYLVIELLLLSLSWFWLHHMDWRGVQCTCAAAVIPFACPLINAYLGTLSFPLTLALLCGTLLYIVPTYIYYRKRRYLFKPRPSVSPQSAAQGACLHKKTKLVVSPMLIKPKYSPGDSTAPMAFYKIQRFFLPFSLLYFAFRGFSDVMDLIHIAQDNNFSAYSVFVLLYASVYYLGTIVLWAFALNGLARMEWSGPRCMFWGCFWSAGQTIVQYALGWFTSEQAGSSLVSALVLFGIVYVYYQKRRNLFTPLPVQQTAAPAPAQPTVKTPDPISPPPEPVSPPAPEAAGEQTVLPEFAPPAPEPPKKKRFSFKLLSVLLAVVCAASLAGNVALYSAQKQFSQQSNTSQQTINGLKQKVAQYDRLNADQVKTINQLKIELAATQNYADVNADAEYILSEYVRFVYSDNYYHTYNCTKYPFKYSNDTFWAHNLEYCQYLGFKPCPYCS